MIIESSFTIDAPAQEVWDFLVDFRRMSVCPPGVEMVEQKDAARYSFSRRQDEF